MIIFRVSKTQYTENLYGEGVRRFGGQWYNKNVPCLYTSESRALAIWEYSINVGLYDIPRALRIMSIEIQDDAVFKIPCSKLPADWQEFPAPGSLKDFGTEFLLIAKFPILPISFYHCARSLITF